MNSPFKEYSIWLWGMVYDEMIPDKAIFFLSFFKLRVDLIVRRRFCVRQRETEFAVQYTWTWYRSTDPTPALFLLKKSAVCKIFLAATLYFLCLESRGRPRSEIQCCQAGTGWKVKWMGIRSWAKIIFKKWKKCNEEIDFGLKKKKEKNNSKGREPEPRTFFDCRQGRHQEGGHFPPPRIFRTILPPGIFF